MPSLRLWRGTREFFRTQYVVLWHPDSPGGRVPVKLTWWRKLSPTRTRYGSATLNDTIRYHNARRLAVETWDNNEYVVGRER